MIFGEKRECKENYRKCQKPLHLKRLLVDFYLKIEGLRSELVGVEGWRSELVGVEGI